MLESPVFHFVRLTPLFSDIPLSSVETLCKKAIVQSFKKDSPIFLRGDSADHIYVIMSGWVKLYRETQEGQEAVIALLGRADTFGETAIFSHDAHSLSAQAVEDSHIIAIPAHAFKQEARENFQLIQKIMTSFSRQVNKLQLENEHLSLMSASQRIGCLLLQFCNGEKNNPATDIHLPYEKSLAASKLGMKPETFSRALAQLRSLGITTQGNIIKVADMRRLVEFVCSDCSACDQDCHFSSLHHCHPDDKAACENKKSF
jgi:CRP-like cAMP-binding protein